MLDAAASGVESTWSGPDGSPNNEQAMVNIMNRKMNFNICPFRIAAS
jgi:hypothetical protein